MKPQDRIASLIVIMVIVALGVMGSVIFVLYNYSLEEHKSHVSETILTHVRLIESIAKFDREYSADYPGGSVEATVSQIREGLTPISGHLEVTLARRMEEHIHFLLRQKASHHYEPTPIPFDSRLAEPMRRALSGRSGTMIGRDYRNETVLAAYEPIPLLDLGIVIKIDMAEIKHPFVRAALISGTLSIVIIIAGTLLFLRVSDPIYQRIFESEEYTRLILETAGEGIYGLDLEGNMTFANQTACRLLGFRAEELNKRPMHDTFHRSDAGGTAHSRKICPIFSTLKDGQTKKVFDAVMWRKDGSSFPVDYTSTPIRRNAKVVGAVVTFNDISERKESQAQLIQASKLATLGEMATAIAHELNQPLNVIRMAAFNAQDSISTGRADEVYLHNKLERIGDETVRAAKIIDHMQIFGRKPGDEPTNLDLRKIANDALGLIREQLRIKSIEVVTQFPEHCRQISGHATIIGQVVLNILTNARDAIEANATSPDAPRQISITVDGTDSGDRVRLIIEDTGGGIANDNLPRVFEPFFTTKEPGKGTGLGLSISYGIVRDMGGEIMISNGRHGARVTVLFPALENKDEGA